MDSILQDMVDQRLVLEDSLSESLGQLSKPEYGIAKACNQRRQSPGLPAESARSRATQMFNAHSPRCPELHAAAASPLARRTTAPWCA